MSGLSSGMRQMEVDAQIRQAHAADREPYRTTTYTERLDALERRMAALEPTPSTDPLPAPALTEDAIVAALKADPAMAGRVITLFAESLVTRDRDRVMSAANDTAGYRNPRPAALQSLAVALAAASYRG